MRRPTLPVAAVLIAVLLSGTWAMLGSPRAASRGTAPEAGSQHNAHVLAGHSALGRRIVAIASGRADAPTRALVVGSIHGSETAGQRIVRRLRRMRVPNGLRLWTVVSVNPDGVARGTRQNARGVDLNRNFSRRWRHQGHPFGTYYSGPRPFSEPESRAVRRLVRTVRPQLTIWYHQAMRLVDLGSGADPALPRAYARRVGLPARRIGFRPGVATRWQNQQFPGTSAFVVELPGGPLGGRAASRHARAVLAVARQVRTSVTADPPPIAQWRIPFGHKRKQEMRRYARRHYGIDDYRLRNPHVIVLHLSVTDSARAVYETFAPDRPDPELGELPNVCSHFVVDERGRIFQLVSLRIMCRHTVGLNYVALGIEHVGRRESQVMGRPRQLRASLRLVRWLQRRYGIRTRNVIGHNESLGSPYHRERVRRLRRQTHADFPRPAANRYRQLLGAGP
jgi:Zinc carboxypeptidase/N-acetylmuramoyl-L-alanine amidase